MAFGFWLFIIDSDEMRFLNAKVEWRREKPREKIEFRIPKNEKRIPKNMKHLIINLLITAAILWGLAMKFPEYLSIDTFVTGIVAAAVLAIINSLVRPIVKLFTLPINFFSLGSFGLVVNALMLMLMDYFVDGLAMGGPFYGFITAAVLSVVLSFLSGIVGRVVGIVV